jgi:hypothetical protein
MRTKVTWLWRRQRSRNNFEPSADETLVDDKLYELADDVILVCGSVVNLDMPSGRGSVAREWPVIRFAE